MNLVSPHFCFYIPFQESISINKWSIENKLEYTDLEIYKGSRFFTCGKMDIKLHQKKKINLNGSCIIANTLNVLGELKRYVRLNTKEIMFLGFKIKFMNVYWTGVSSNGNLLACSTK